MVLITAINSSQLFRQTIIKLITVFEEERNCLMNVMYILRNLVCRRPKNA